eukprot:3803613-Rhodomonas_salina.1
MAPGTVGSRSINFVIVGPMMAESAASELSHLIKSVRAFDTLDTQSLIFLTPMSSSSAITLFSAFQYVVGSVSKRGS